MRHLPFPHRPLALQAWLPRALVGLTLAVAAFGYGASVAWAAEPTREHPAATAAPTVERPAVEQGAPGSRLDRHLPVPAIPAARTRPLPSRTAEPETLCACVRSAQHG